MVNGDMNGEVKQGQECRLVSQCTCCVCKKSTKILMKIRTAGHTQPKPSGVDATDWQKHNCKEFQESERSSTIAK